MEKQYPSRKHPSFKGLIGIARQDITPPAGIYSRNWGASRYDIAEGVHQPLTLTCISFRADEGGAPLVMIAADLGWWKTAADEQRLRHGILEAFQLDPSQLMFCLAHTHAGPSICRDDAAKPGGHLIEGYLDLLLRCSIVAVRESLASAKTAWLTWHYGKCDLATNRDLPDLEKNRVLVGFNPALPADDTLLVGRITDKDYNLLGTIVNYACHPTTLAWDNRLISPDYIGSMRALVEQQTKAPCAFLQGASGELSPAEQYVGDTRLTDRYGRSLGYAVLATLEAMLPPGEALSFDRVVESSAPLAIWIKTPQAASTTLTGLHTTVDLPLKPLPSLAEIEAQWEACEDRVLKERLWRLRGTRKTVGDGTTAGIGLWIWQLGDAILVGQPNEPYAEYQLELRRHLAPCAVAVINIVNGYTGYLAPKSLYDQDIYSVWQSPFAAGSLELLTEATRKLARIMINS